MKNNKLAFTLAEVLITLGIIGIVAAMTIPTLITNYQKKQTSTQLKKDYSQLTQALGMAQIEYGDLAQWEYTGNSAYEKSKNYTDKYIVPYLKVVKQCQVNASDSSNQCYFNPKGLNGTANVLTNLSSHEALFLADGSELIINAEQPVYKMIYIDINGTKSPNTLGKDTFSFEFSLYTGKFNPRYAYGTVEETIANEANRCNKNQNGLACTNLIWLQNWEITKDYPW